jgi:hypothetical protein
MVSSVIKKLKLAILPKRRRIYVVLEGKYKGEWLVQVKETTDTIVCFSLPDKFVREIPKKEFIWGIINKLLDPVDVLPKSIYNVCLAEYNHKATDEQRNNALDRRKQHSPSDPLGSE